MINYIWGAMILIGIIVGTFTGNMPEVTNAAIEGGKEAVGVCITMLGVVAAWTGLMKIGEKSGLIKELSNKLEPLLSFLFPNLPKKSAAREYIATNFVANFFGLGWAATPAGLKAMSELQKLNKNKNKASKEMCMFLVVNMSSLQLISVNLISYRSQYNSANPSEIIGPSLLASIISTVIAIIIAKFCERWYIK